MSINKKSRVNNLGMFSKLGIFSSFLLITALSVYIYSPIIRSNASETPGLETEVDVNPVVSITLSTDTLEFNIVPTESGVFESKSVTATVGTNSTGGYELYFSSEDNNTSMPNIDSEVLDVIASDFNGTVTSSTMEANKWGYSLDNTDFSKIPALNNQITLKNIDHFPTASEKTSTVHIGTKISTDLTAGTYSKNIKFSAIAHATPSYTITWDMNDGTANPDATYPTEVNQGKKIDLSILTPIRSNYTFMGWSNGTTTFTGEETAANINPSRLGAITMTAQWRRIIADCAECTHTDVDLAVNESIDFDYSGTVVQATMKKTGNYKLEVWGASGGQGAGGGTDGFGGYATGNMSFLNDDKVFVVVGGAGTTYRNNSNPVYKDGGYNGGGNCGFYATWNDGTYSIDGCGGGATHMAFASGILSELEDKQDDVIIVAGGGGGGEYRYTAHNGYSWYNYGGSGGGAYHNRGYSDVAGYDDTYINSDNYLCADGAIFGAGTNGGGGGWYGGTTSWDRGCGGMGYIGYSGLSEKVMYSFQHASSKNQGCVESSEEDTKTVCTTNKSDTAISGYAKSGNGYARITYLGTSI